MAVIKIAWIPLVLVTLSLVSAQDHGIRPLCECMPREVGLSGSRKDWPGYRKGPMAWHSSIDEALKIARFEQKLVFWYHVAGDLDKEGC
jgi:hypothetical protein